MLLTTPSHSLTPVLQTLLTKAHDQLAAALSQGESAVREKDDALAALKQQLDEGTQEHLVRSSSITTSLKIQPASRHACLKIQPDSKLQHA